MRISTANSFDAGIANLQRRQVELTEGQLQLTSGKRVSRASDDPTAAARAERARALEQRSTASQRAVEASRNAMQLAEGALGDATELLQQARETLVSAGNASYSDAERRTLAQSLQAIRNQLFAVANRPDGAGGYLFAGQGSSSPPFIDAAGGVQFAGTAGQSEAASGESLPTTLDGQAGWLQARSGNGVFVTSPGSPQAGAAWIDPGRVTDPSALTGDDYSLTFSVVGGVTTYSISGTAGGAIQSGTPYVSGQAISFEGLSFSIRGAPADGDAFTVEPSTSDLSVFTVLDEAVAALETPLQNNGRVTQSVAVGIRDIDASLGRLIEQRAQAGETLKLIDGVEGRLSALKLGAQTEQSAAEDLDMVEAFSRFQAQQTGYDAALKSYSMVQRMSLFQYLGG
jgi:flagellar hook-associated protein 3 FlgL